jgi:branched-chain amino acid transport system ATP-binding protein
MTSALSVENLGLTIGGAKILEGITLSVNQNETLGIIGPNGAGKTSFFNLLSGLREATTGTIHLGDKEITNLKPHQRAQAGIARTFQTSSIFPFLSLLENVRIAAQVADGSSMNLTKGADKYKDVLYHASACLDQVGLLSKGALFAGALSHGDKRRLEIAALVEIIRSLATVHKKTVLIVEHHMEVILGLADRIAVLNYGELLTIDTPQNVMDNPTVQSAYLGAEL